MIEAQEREDLTPPASSVTVQAQNYTHPSTIQIRLDTQNILLNFEVYLRGSRLIVEEKDGEYINKEIPLGEALANKVGTQNLMNRLTLILNPSVVQGNYTEQFWRFEMAGIRKSIAISTMYNLYRWGVNEEHYKEICDSICTCIKAYLSRLKDNKERESFSNTLQSFERTTLGEQKKGFRLFGRSQQPAQT